MLCKIKTMQDVVSLGLHLPMAVRDELVRSTAILDYEYGPARDDTDGGYSILLNEKKDLEELKAIVDYERHLPEWVSRFENYIAALYIMTNDLSVLVFMPEEIAPVTIRKELDCDEEN